MKRFTTAETSLEEIASAIAPSLPPDLAEMDAQVRDIIEDVRARGDEAICEYIARFDRARLTPSELKVKTAELAAAREEMGKELEPALELASGNIRRFHEKQLPTERLDSEASGAVLGEKFTPVERVGIHIPGATAPLMSSVLMTVIPAQVAGVKEIHVATPPRPDGTIDAARLAAMEYLGVSSIFKTAGPAAVSAFAFGTQSIPKVDKIVGPGNIYTTLAKRQVYGIVGIDGLYGPSEVVVIADGGANAAWVAADLLAQAEHRNDSCAILISTSEELIERVLEEIESQLQILSTGETARESWEKYGAVVLAADLAEAVALSNLIAPEHLELQVADPQEVLEMVKAAGCILLGYNTPTSASDYVAGPSHCLPTGRSAAFSSGLGVMDFMKRSDIVGLSAEALESYAEAITQFADLEGLEAHAAAVRKRIAKPKDNKTTK